MTYKLNEYSVLIKAFALDCRSYFLYLFRKPEIEKKELLSMNYFISTRLEFIRPEKRHLDFYKTYLSDFDLTRFLPLERPYTEDEILDYMNQRIIHFEKYGFGVWLLCMKSTANIIGYCGFEYANNTQYIDIRYGLLKEYHKKGFAIEAGKKALDTAFDFLKIKTVYAAALKENIASQKRLLSLGFKPCTDANFYGNLIDYFKISR